MLLYPAPTNHIKIKMDVAYVKKQPGAGTGKGTQLLGKQIFFDTQEAF